MQEVRRSHAGAGVALTNKLLFKSSKVQRFEQLEQLERLELFLFLNVEFLRSVIVMAPAGDRALAWKQPVDLRQIVGRQNKFRRSGILFQMRNPMGSGNRHEVISLVQDPCERQLRQCALFRRGHSLQ